MASAGAGVGVLPRHRRHRCLRHRNGEGRADDLVDLDALDEVLVGRNPSRDRRFSAARLPARTLIRRRTCPSDCMSLSYGADLLGSWPDRTHAARKRPRFDSAWPRPARGHEQRIDASRPESGGTGRRRRTPRDASSTEVRPPRRSWRPDAGVLRRPSSMPARRSDRTRTSPIQGHGPHAVSSIARSTASTWPSRSRSATSQSPPPHVPHRPSRIDRSMPLTWPL